LAYPRLHNGLTEPAISQTQIAGAARPHPSQVRRIPGSGEKQPPARLLLECLKNRTGRPRRYAIRGYLSTAAKRGISVFTAILGALTGNAWMPPVPEHA
jgi:hypothetical protein